MVATKAGWIGKREVVEVKFDPKLVSREKLVAHLPECTEGTTVEEPGEIRWVEDQKYYIKGAWRAVPMTEAQACRLHAGFGGQKGGPDEWLSPRQLALLARLTRADPEEKTVDAYGRPLAEQWWKLMAMPTKPPEADETQQPAIQ